MRKKISEIDVLIAVALWLRVNNYVLKTISIPKGQGINARESEQKLKKKFSEANISSDSIHFSPSGPDIIASINNKLWKIECKGLGTGKSSTLRNNFDRALSSAVSYYDSKTGLRIGLALPKKDEYLNLISSKIPQALRESLDLWIFLYNSDDNSIEVIDPTRQISQKKRNIEEAIWI